LASITENAEIHYGLNGRYTVSNKPYYKAISVP